MTPKQEKLYWEYTSTINGMVVEALQKPDTAGVLSIALLEGWCRTLLPLPPEAFDDLYKSIPGVYHRIVETNDKMVAALAAALAIQKAGAK